MPDWLCSRRVACARKGDPDGHHAAHVSALFLLFGPAAVSQGSPILRLSALDSPRETRFWFFASWVANLSLFPLLFSPTGALLLMRFLLASTCIAADSPLRCCLLFCRGPCEVPALCDLHAAGANAAATLLGTTERRECATAAAGGVGVRARPFADRSRFACCLVRCSVCFCAHLSSLAQRTAGASCRCWRSTACWLRRCCQGVCVTAFAVLSFRCCAVCRLPFLPLLFMSVYCALGTCYTWFVSIRAPALIRPVHSARFSRWRCWQQFWRDARNAETLRPHAD